jgi:hypothetical protein
MESMDQLNQLPSIEGRAQLMTAVEPPPGIQPLLKSPTQYLSCYFLTSELGHGAMGVTHDGWLEALPMHRRSGLRVAAKFAFTVDQQGDVAYEHSIYLHLQAKGVSGIPTVYGIFHDIERMLSPSCILMAYSGTSLCVKLSISNTPISDSQRQVHRCNIAQVLVNLH